MPPRNQLCSYHYPVPIRKRQNISYMLSIAKVPSVVNIASNKPNVKSILTESQWALQDIPNVVC